MKKSRLLIVLLLVAIVCLSLVACTEEHEHTYEWTIETAPTATEKGVATGKCSCGVTTAVALPALSDTSVWTKSEAESVAATCQAEGSTVYTSVYGKVTVAEAKTDHTYGALAFVTEPTETVPGSAKKVCSVEGCGHEETVALPVLTDSSFWTLTETAATHKAEGSKVYANQDSGLSVTITIAQIPHTFQKIVDEKFVASAATCQSAATYYYSCVCGEHNEQTFTAGTARGHVYGAWSLVGTPTAEAGAKVSRTCLVCNDDTQTEDVPALTDTSFWTVSTVAATHYEAGKATYTNETYKVQVEVVLAIIAHTYDQKVVEDKYLAHAANCTQKATYYYSCECGAIGTKTFENGDVHHEWSDKYAVVIERHYDSDDWNSYEDVETEYHARVCSLCGATDNANKQAHTYVVTEVYTKADSLGNGTIQGYSVLGKQACSGCGKKHEDEKAYGYINIANPERSDYTLNTHVDATYEAAGYDEYVKNSDETFTVRIPIAKLVAPYESKVYSVVNVYFNNEVATRTAAYTGYNLELAIDEKGEGSAGMYPFYGSYKFTMVDATTGKISAVLTSNSGSKTVFEGYVSEIGVIVMTSNGYQDIFVLSPYGITTDDVQASRFAGTTAIHYHVDCNTHIGHDYNIAIIGEEAYFEASFTDFDGNNLPVSEIVTRVDSDVYTTCNFVQVAAKDGTVLAAYVSNGTTLVEADGLQGKYAVDLGEGQGTLALSGNGTFTFGNKSGTYTVVSGESYTADLFVVENGVNVAYYELTVAEGVASVNKPMVTITFVVGELGEALSPISVNAKVACKLPVAVSTDADYVLVGWFFDEDCTEGQQVDADFIPTENVTLYAKWGNEVIVTIIDAQNPAEPASIASGSALSAAIPEANIYEENQLSADGKFFFTGWYVDVNRNGVVDEGDLEADLEAIVNRSDFPEGLTVIAQWTAVPEYVGTYYGAEVYGKSNIGSKYGLTIDHIGNIKYFEVDYSTKQPKYVHEGYVVGYDAASGVLTWTQTKYNGNANSKEFTVYFDSASKVFMGFYDNQVIGTDFLFFSQNIQVGNAPSAAYAIKVPGASSQGYYARIIVAPTALGENTIVYSINNKIYSNVSITNALGEALSVADKGADSIGESSTIVIRDSEGNVLLARGNQSGKTFTNGTNTVELGAEFGEYVAGEGGSLKLDGTGAALYEIGGATKKGTYAAIEGGYEFYVVVDGVNTEYYTFTLQDSAATVVKPTVQITFVTEYGTQQAIDANVNIAIELPVLTDETHVFRGWKITGTDSVLGATHVFTEAKELTAIWLEKVTITIVYNDGTTETVQKEYGKGETVKVTEPVWEKHAFDGWFTTESFEVGTEWTSGNVITENVTIYAKWSDAPIYNAKYTPLEVTGTNANGAKDQSAYARTSAVLDVNTKGVAEGAGYPYRGTVKISDYDAVAGTVTFEFAGQRYAAFMNAAGLIVVSRSTGSDLAEVNVLAMNYVTSDTVKYSYWNGGKTRCIVYTSNGESTNIFVYQNKVYFGVSFTDTLGNAIAATSCFESPELLVKDASGELIAKFGFDGTTMAVMDGYEGTYSNGSESITLNGIKTITIGENTGTYTKAAEGAGYTFEVYITENGKTVHYQLTVDKDAHTYTIVKPEVTFTFISEYGEFQSSVQVNTGEGLVYTLPAELTSETHTFLGWYRTGDETQTIVTNIEDPSEAMSFTAKWAEKVVLTIVYSNGLENRIVDLYAGATLDMNDYKISWANNHLFEGWYSDSEFSTAFSATTIESAITVYAKWSEEEIEPYTISSENVAWTYDEATGVYTSGNKGKNSSKSVMVITAIADVTVTFQYGASSEAEAKWDYLHIDLVSGSTTTKQATSGGKVDPIVFKTFTITLKAGQKLKLVYEKDSSSEGGLDIAQIKDLVITVA